MNGKSSIAFLGTTQETNSRSHAKLSHTLPVHLAVEKGYKKVANNVKLISTTLNKQMYPYTYKDTFNIEY